MYEHENIIWRVEDERIGMYKKVNNWNAQYT